jgi:hypothetical protein
LGLDPKSIVQIEQEQARGNPVQNGQGVKPNFMNGEPTDPQSDALSILYRNHCRAEHSNLSIVQVTGLGLVGHNRSKSLMKRLEVLRLMLKLRHPDISFIDYKEYALMFEGDGWWFNHNRGSNEYLSSGAIASFGVPYQDIGSLKMIYITLTGDYSVSRESPTTIRSTNSDSKLNLIL